MVRIGHLGAQADAMRGGVRDIADIGQRAGEPPGGVGRHRHAHLLPHAVAAQFRFRHAGHHPELAHVCHDEGRSACSGLHQQALGRGARHDAAGERAAHLHFGLHPPGLFDLVDVGAVQSEQAQRLARRAVGAFGGLLVRNVLLQFPLRDALPGGQALGALQRLGAGLQVAGCRDQGGRGLGQIRNLHRIQQLALAHLVTGTCQHPADPALVGREHLDRMVLVEVNHAEGLAPSLEGAALDAAHLHLRHLVGLEPHRVAVQQQCRGCRRRLRRLRLAQQQQQHPEADHDSARNRQRQTPPLQQGRERLAGGRIGTHAGLGTARGRLRHSRSCKLTGH
mmetsp:Transcript_5519/g.13311  ORF Transcript_5519/g.13311 Transcript_5519/m.13311 type:complete len:337 (-) Transcript_5519:3243-4253(-)